MMGYCYFLCCSRCTAAIGDRMAPGRQVWRPSHCLYNKMDRIGADYFRAVNMIRTGLGSEPVMLHLPIGVEDLSLGSLTWYRSRPIYEEESGEALSDQRADRRTDGRSPAYRQQLLEKIAEFDDYILEKYLDGKSASKKYKILAQPYHSK